MTVAPAPTTTDLKLDQEFPGDVAPDARKGYSGYVVKPEKLVEVATALRDKHGYDYCSSATGVDYLEQGLCEMVYHLYNTKTGGPAVVLKAQTPRGGRIINNGSISAHVPRPHSAPYTASKHGMTGLTRSTGLDGRAFDIACGQIDIGNAETDMARGYAGGVLQANGQHAIEPLLPVPHVVDAVLYMAALPLDANVPFITVMASGMPYLGRG